MTPKQRLQEAAHRLAGSAEKLEEVICPPLRQIGDGFGDFLPFLLDNIGYPGGDLIFNVNGGLICRGQCVKLWGNSGDHVTSCPIFKFLTSPNVVRGCPFCGNSYSNGPCVGCAPVPPKVTSISVRCIGTCAAMWGVPGDHLGSCQFAPKSSPIPMPGLALLRHQVGVTRCVTCGIPLNLGYLHYYGMCDPAGGGVALSPGPATAPIGHPVAAAKMDKKAAGWKGHEHYGYDSDVD